MVRSAFVVLGIRGRLTGRGLFGAGLFGGLLGGLGGLLAVALHALELVVGLARHITLRKNTRAQRTGIPGALGSLYQTWRGPRTVPAKALGRLQLARGHLAAALIALQLEADLLAFVERAEARTLDGRDVHENVVAAVVGLDEAEALSGVEPLHGAGSHGVVSHMQVVAHPGWDNASKVGWI